jgi:hypothetical protein
MDICNTGPRPQDAGGKGKKRQLKEPQEQPTQARKSGPSRKPKHIPDPNNPKPFRCNKMDDWNMKPCTAAFEQKYALNNHQRSSRIIHPDTYKQNQFVSLRYHLEFKAHM